MGAESLALILFAFVLTYAIHSTLLLGLACVVSRRVAALRARERLWKVALFGGLVTALAQVGFGWHTPFAHWSLRSPAAAEQASVEVPAPVSVDESATDLAPIVGEEQMGDDASVENATELVQRALLHLTRFDKLREPR